MHASNVAFPEAMADAAMSVAEHFKGNIAYINVMKKPLRGTATAAVVAEDPCMQDIGMLASLDPVAVDQACMDLVIRSDDPGRDHFLERVNSRNGLHTLEAAAELGYGSRGIRADRVLNGGAGATRPLRKVVPPCPRLPKR